MNSERNNICSEVVDIIRYQIASKSILVYIHNILRGFVVVKIVRFSGADDIR